MELIYPQKIAWAFPECIHGHREFLHPLLLVKKSREGECTEQSGISLIALYFLPMQHTVKSAFAPEDFNWNSSSEAEYAALAGVAIPESRWTA